MEPRNKKLKVHAISRSNTVAVTFPTIEDVAEETVITFHDDLNKRRNGNSELWIGLTKKATEYLTAVAAHRVATYETKGADEAGEDAEGEDAEDGECADASGATVEGDRRIDDRSKKPVQLKISNFFS
jgi:hypothetical protein